MSYRNIFLILFLLLLPFLLNSYEKYIDFDLIKKPGPPRFVQNGVLFTLPGNEGGIAFIRTNIDNWEKNYYYNESLYGVLYVFIKINENTKSLKYMINVNGYWIEDPYNPDYQEDAFSTKLYYLEVPEEAKYYDEMPAIEETDSKVKNVTFRYYSPYANEVNFVCSIDNWAQYSHPMVKDKYGYWIITKKFTQGTYYYFFFEDGEKKVDLENKNRMWDTIKGQVSYFTVY